MITIRIPLDSIMNWFMPVFLISIGTILLLVDGKIIFYIAGPIFIIPGILWCISNLGIVRFKTE